MKYSKIYMGLLALSLVTVGCQIEGINEEVPQLIDNAAGNYDKIFDISTDNSGTVKITPIGQGISKSIVAFGHGTGAAASAVLTPGASVTHVYPEGSYTVTITTTDLTGNETVTTYPLEVKFTAPTDVQIETSLAGNTLTVTPKGVNATGGYRVFFGETSTETGVLVPQGGSATYTYAAPGIYNVRVVALSGGQATTTVSQEVTVFQPFGLPVSYENPLVNYGVGGTFGGVSTRIIENPYSEGTNTTAKVLEYTKGAGAESWAGTWTPLGAPNGTPVLLENGTKFTIQVYATETGKSLRFQLEDGQGFNPGVEVPITTANAWQTLTFDFSSQNIDPAHVFGQYVIQYNLSASGNGEVLLIDNITQTN